MAQPGEDKVGRGAAVFQGHHKYSIRGKYVC